MCVLCLCLGYGIAFTDKAGVSSTSHIMLSYNDVPEVWLKASDLSYMRFVTDTCTVW